MSARRPEELALDGQGEPLPESVRAGANGVWLAEQLGVSIAELFAHNVAGTLFVAAHRDEPPYGGNAATTYRFRIGMMRAYMTFEEGTPPRSGMNNC